jgi:hypothetical protein
MLRCACRPAAPRLSGVPAQSKFSGVEGRTSPAIGLLSRPNVDPALTGYATNTTCWGLLKQPDEHELTTSVSPAPRTLF